MNPKTQQIIRVLLLLGVTVGGLSAFGVVQFTETLDSSGIVIESGTPPIPLDGLFAIVN
jgi:hypothetical protein